MKVCTVIGARPQFVKAAVVSRAMSAHKHIDEVILHTGQHYDANMSTQFFDELNIPKPTYHLNVGSGSHGVQTGQMLERIEAVLLDEKPDWVLVYGDTNSTLAGALAAVKLHIPVAHVEAGLRSFNRKMPEEINRIATDSVSNLLFVPTKVAEQQLLKEGVNPSQVCQVGDVMYDATLYYNAQNLHRETIVDTLQLGSKSYGLVTLHRAENTDNPQRMQHIVDALVALSKQHTLVFPLHPRTRKSLGEMNLLKHLETHLKVLEPIGFLDMLALEQHAMCIVTDSGGVQKEAYFNRVPCVTLRDETEWVELVDAGWNRLCSPSTSFSLLNDFDANDVSSRESGGSLYGNGDASEKIVKQLLLSTSNQVEASMMV
ncbi:MAG: UDP-N-acetylglucosamine 2-epimerase (non-hydrolyzing) [Legionellaceae bacterium]|nr:UDP-N-acetylglucosamine 2-epimerase (non-hydrolyzing) [Legionellaceae bacterium]